MPVYNIPVVTTRESVNYDHFVVIADSEEEAYRYAFQLKTEELRQGLTVFSDHQPAVVHLDNPDLSSKYLPEPE